MHAVHMAKLQQKIRAEHQMRTLLEENGLPQPDHVEYGHTCIRLLWYEQKAAVIIDIDEPPPDAGFVEECEEVMPPDEEATTR